MNEPYLRSRKRVPADYRLRVLVVDDSVVIRRLVSHALQEDPAIELVGTASNGLIGLARAEQLNPDVITVDVEMPDMDGLEMVRRLRMTNKDVRVIMFSTLTERGAWVSMEALSLGADDYVAKASNAGSLDRSMHSLREELIPKIKQFFLRESDGRLLAGRSAAVRPLAVVPVAHSHVEPEVVSIGVSTGGPNALSVVMPMLPGDFPVPILIVQHMPPIFTRLLAERLQGLTKLRVCEAQEGMPVEAGSVLIAPGNYHMCVRREGLRKVVTLNQERPENSCRPSVDVLFRSVEQSYGAATVGVILTGMGTDGLRGAQLLKARGASMIAQDEASSVVWGMPGAVVEAGLADAVVPLEKIAGEIVAKVRSRSTMPRLEWKRYANA